MIVAGHNQRISFKRKRPNPLFQEWLEELYDEAKSKGSKLTPMLSQALESISKYPLPLKTGAECVILKGFEKKLCIFLDKRLEVYNSNKNLKDSQASEESDSDEEKISHDDIVIKSNNENNLRYEQPSSSSQQSNSARHLRNGYCSSTSSESTLNTDLQQQNFKKSKEYRPAYRSGGYAILIALLEKTHYQNSKSSGLTKEILIEKAQKHSEESFVSSKPYTYYTAWSNMTRLVTKGLVKKTKNKKVLYSLTDQGIAIATELLKESQNIPTMNDIIFNSNADTPLSSQRNEVTHAIETPSSSSQVFENQSSNTEVELIKMPTGSFEVILLIDKNETGGTSKKNDPTVAQFNKYPDMIHEYRSLKVGDFTWIARSKLDKNIEFVLPYVVERKRMDDFGASIKDGRFHEQKFRLRKCGLDNIIYLVENYGSNKHVGLPITYLMQALANTRVQDGFKIHVTDSLTGSCRFLAMMTKRLILEFKDRDLKGCSENTEEHLMTFEYFNKASLKSKTLTVTETFIKLLLQLKGVSVEKALAIANVYSTPTALLKAYSNCPKEKDAVMLLAHLKYGNTNRNVGPSVSKSLYHLFHIK